VNGGQEVACCFVIASSDGAKEFEFCEEVFNQVAGFIEIFVILSLHFTVGLGRYNRGFARFLQGDQHALIGVETFVGKHRIGFHMRQQHIRTVQIAGLAAGEMKADWVAQGINRGVNLGAQSAFAATDGLVEAPFFSAPALCW
jgi:hypothetical protein